MKKIFLTLAIIAGATALTMAPKIVKAQAKAEQQATVKPTAAVKAAFDKEYPSAVDVKWTKTKDLYTAQFGSGIFRATVHYNASGERVDNTGTVIKKSGK